MEQYCGVILPTVGRFSLNRRNSLVLWPVHKSELHIRSLIKQVDGLTVPWQYTLSLMVFIINNQGIFQTNSTTHNSNTRNKQHLHRSKAKPSPFQTKSTFYAAINPFNNWSPSVTILKNGKEIFRAAFRKYLTTHTALLCRWPIDV
jgi:hypothetical protein